MTDSKNLGKVNDLEDFKINVKIKLAALWTSVTLCYLYGDYFELYVPKKVEGLVSGINMLDSPVKLFLASFLFGDPRSDGFSFHRLWLLTMEVKNKVQLNLAATK